MSCIYDIYLLLKFYPKNESLNEQDPKKNIEVNSINGQTGGRKS